MDNNIFNWEQYIANYEDLRNVGINTEEKAFDHWIKYGQYEGRSFSKTDNLFNWKQYIANYEDLRNAGINTEEKAFDHWIKHGYYEGRSFSKIDNLFNWEHYIANYEDLRNAGINTEEKAFDHWIKHGQYEGRSCNTNNIKNNNFISFDWSNYLENNEDLLNKDILTHEQAYNHWINYGINENRQVVKQIINENSELIIPSDHFKNQIDLKFSDWEKYFN